MKQYSEQDIQDYVDGTFAGDVKDMETYLETNHNAQRQLQLYKTLYSALEQQPVPSLSIDLAALGLSFIFLYLLDQFTGIRSGYLALGIITLFLSFGFLIYYNIIKNK